jgi:hypothetical protein
MRVQRRDTFAKIRCPSPAVNKIKQTRSYNRNARVFSPSNSLYEQTNGDHLMGSFADLNRKEQSSDNWLNECCRAWGQRAPILSAWEKQSWCQRYGSWAYPFCNCQHRCPAAIYVIEGLDSKLAKPRRHEEMSNLRQEFVSRRITFVAE